MTKYVISTATATTNFDDHVDKGGMMTVVRRVRVNGGSNIASLSSGFGDRTKDEGGSPLWTPAGVVTPITDEDAEFLSNHRVFQIGVAAGFYQITDKELGSDHRKVKAATLDMTSSDKSAPLTTETMKSRVSVTTKIEVD